MQLVPVIEIVITDNDKYKINGSVKKERFDEALNTLHISHKKSIRNRNVVDLNIRDRKYRNSENDVKGVSERHNN